MLSKIFLFIVNFLFTCTHAVGKLFNLSRQIVSHKNEYLIFMLLPSAFLESTKRIFHKLPLIHWLTATPFTLINHSLYFINCLSSNNTIFYRLFCSFTSFFDTFYSRSVKKQKNLLLLASFHTLSLSCVRKFVRQYNLIYYRPRFILFIFLHSFFVLSLSHFCFCYCCWNFKKARASVCIFSIRTMQRSGIDWDKFSTTECVW